MLTAVIDYVTVKVHQLRSVHSSDSLTNMSQGICPAKLIARLCHRSNYARQGGSVGNIGRIANVINFLCGPREVGRSVFPVVEDKEGMMVDNMKLLALLAALPLQYQTLFLVSSPDGHTRTSGRCLQAWRSTASPRAIFSLGHGLNVSASTRPRHEGRRRCVGLLAQSPGTRGAGFIRTCCAESASFREYHSSVSPHGGLWGTSQLPFDSESTSERPPWCRAQHARRRTGRLHQRRGFDVLQHGTRCQCLFHPPPVGAQQITLGQVRAAGR